MQIQYKAPRNWLQTLLQTEIAQGMYCRSPELPGKVAEAFGGLYRLFSRKYWVDEIYVACLVRPTLWLADNLLLGVVDTRGIEGVVNGVPRAIGRLSTSLRRIQDGQVAHYLTWPCRNWALSGAGRWP